MEPDVPLPSLLDLIRQLVRLPSRADSDALDPVVHCVSGWLGSRGIEATPVTAPDGSLAGVQAGITGRSAAGPWLVLDATLDTAGFGDVAAWSEDPLGAQLSAGWLYGRGSGDSKAGVALFAHLIADLACRREHWQGRLSVLFDGDEHTGRFGGARAWFDRFRDPACQPRPSGVLLGYPGMERIVIGGRGFLRAVITVHGRAAHSGSLRQRGVNAVTRAAELCLQLAALPLPAAASVGEAGPQLTVTGIETPSQGFSQVPDLCRLRLDVRCVPGWDHGKALEAISEVVAHFDAAHRLAPAGDPGAADTASGSAATQIEWLPGWPPCALAADQPMVAALQAAARAELGRTLPAALAGPSSIGNYLATLGIPAVCGFGVQAEALHAVDERIAVASIAPVYRIYHAALLALLQPGTGAGS